MFLITRPEPKGSKLKALLDSEYLPSFLYPTINVKQLPTVNSTHDKYDIIVVTSTYTIDWLISPAQSTLHSTQFTVAIGTATQTALLNTALPWAQKIITPAQQNSEGVLSMPELADVKGKRVLIVKGQKGRKLLQERLRSNGADVDVVNVYERQANVDKKLIRQVEEQAITCIIVTSVEIAEQLFASFCTDWLKNKKWIATSQRIANFLSAKKMCGIHISESADNQAIIRLAAILSAQNP